MNLIMRGRAAAVAVFVAVALIVVTVRYCTNEVQREKHVLLVSRTLRPLAVLLKENAALLAELESAQFAEKDSGILESYLAKVRRDGVAKHADMKQRLDQLAENNTAIVTLIKAYGSDAKTAAFTTEADKFRIYASAWRDRWNSVMELFMAGGNYAVAGVPLPSGFFAVVDLEVAAAK